MSTPDTEWEVRVKKMLELGVNGFSVIAKDENINVYEGEVLLPFSELIRLLSSRDTYWKERVSRAFVLIDTDIQELVTDEKGMVPKEQALRCVRRTEKELDTLLDNLK